MFFGLSIVDKILWAGIICANAYLFFLLVRRHRKHHPAFTTFIGVSLAKSLLLVTIHTFFSPTLYFLAYYFGMGFVALALGFAAIEVAAKVFAPYNTIPASFVIRLVGAVSLTMFLAYAAATTQEIGTNGTYWAKLITLERFSQLVTFGGVLVTTYIAFQINLPWDTQSKAVASGLLFYMPVQSINSAFALYGAQAYMTRPVGMVAYLIAQLVWIQAFRKDPRPMLEVNAELIELLRGKLDSIRERMNAGSINL